MRFEGHHQRLIPHIPLPVSGCEGSSSFDKPRLHMADALNIGDSAQGYKQDDKSPVCPPWALQWPEPSSDLRAGQSPSGQPLLWQRPEPSLQGAASSHAAFWVPCADPAGLERTLGRQWHGIVRRCRIFPLLQRSGLLYCAYSHISCVDRHASSPASTHVNQRFRYDEITCREVH